MAAGDGGASPAVELELYGDIGAGMFGIGITAGAVSAALRDHMDAAQINVRINSPGGEVAEGLAIYNILAQHPARVRVQIDGIAASIASVIAMAGDEIAISEAGMLMIHDPWTGVRGNAAELHRVADVLDKWGSAMAGLYAARSGKSPQKMRQMMLAETWLDAAEAKRAGLATSIIKNKTPDSKAKAEVGELVIRGNFRNAPIEALEALGITVEPDEGPGVPQIAANLELVEKIEGLALQPGDELDVIAGAVPFADLPVTTDAFNPHGDSDATIEAEILGSPPDWHRYKLAHLWFDPTNQKSKDGYKLKIARMRGGRLTVFYQRLASRIALLNGARQGVDIPEKDRRACYNVAVRYYKKLGKTPPPLKSRAELDEMIADFDLDEEIEPDLDAGASGVVEGAPDPTTVQTVIFAKKQFPQKAKCEAWLKRNKFKSDTVRETASSWRYRQKPPSAFEPGSFRTIPFTNGVMAVIGKLKKKAELETDAINADGTVRSLGLALVDMLGRTDELDWPAPYRDHVRQLLAADLARVHNDRSRDAIGALLDAGRGPLLGHLTETDT